MENITTTIKTKLAELEKQHGIKILFAIESGSRAWGFPSPDSDYDVRFVYAHHPDWYLSIYEEADTLDLPINAVLDINGWDLRKALRLLAKHNAVLHEWIQSPVVYSSDKSFTDGFNKTAPSCFSAIAFMHHYLNMSKKYYEECTAGETAKLKKYLYCLRTTLTCLWIIKYKTVPPMELEKLMPLMNDRKDLIHYTEELIRLKATKDESYMHGRDAAFEKYLIDGIAACEEAAPSLPPSKPDYKVLNDLFRKTIQSAR